MKRNSDVGFVLYSTFESWEFDCLLWSFINLYAVYNWFDFALSVHIIKYCFSEGKITTR